MAQTKKSNRSPSNNFNCPYCHTSLPSHAVFCGCCGKQVQVRKNGKREKRTVNGYFGEQGQNDDTVRITSISQKHLKRRKSSRLPENKHIPKQSHTNSLLYRTIAIDFPVPLLPYSFESEIPKPELEDTQPRLAVPLQHAPLQSVPATLNPAMSGIMQKIPDTEVPVFLEEVAQKSSADYWFWPAIIILSAFAAYIVTFVMPYVVIRPVVVMWFLFICPGMVLVRFLRLKDVAVEWTFAIALSFSIDAFVASIFLFAGKWSPTGILSLLIGICLCGAIVHFATLRR